MSSEPTHAPFPPESQWFPNGRWRDQGPAVELDRRRPRQARFQDRRWLHALLFLATLLTTTLIGALHYVGFSTDFLDDAPIALSLVQGFWYSVPILAILGAHEMGHYLMCRHYEVDASLPYFIPVPPNLLLTGTLGAFIRIREPIPTKLVLFDIGVAGPIAGFVVAVPLLFVGLSLSRIVMLPPDFVGLELGEPLLFQLAAWLTLGTAPEGYSINLHPMGFAAWFGLLATMLNLFPFGQLDGGHISYAALGSRSTLVTVGTVTCVIGLTFLSLSWFAWALMMIVMLFTLGPRHPRTVDDHLPLDRTRRRVAAGAAVIFVLCFTAAPIDVSGLLPQEETGIREQVSAESLRSPVAIEGGGSPRLGPDTGRAEQRKVRARRSAPRAQIADRRRSSPSAAARAVPPAPPSAPRASPLWKFPSRTAVPGAHPSTWRVGRVPAQAHERPAR